MIMELLLATVISGPVPLPQTGGGKTPAPRPPATQPRAQPAPQAVSPKNFRQKVEIQADKLEIQGRGNQLVWTGNVKAKRGTTDLSCTRLIAHYTPDQQISRIECDGDVEIVDGDRWARGEHAEFDNIKGILVITGSPQAMQGPNLMRGSKVTFHMERDVVEVQDPVVTVHPDEVPGRKK